LEKGIRQGAKLSTHLCSIYMKSFVKECFSDFNPTNGDFYVYTADDILFVTRTKDKAYNTLKRIYEKAQDYSFELNGEKLRTNLSPRKFQLGSQCIEISSQHNTETALFSSCGVNFKTGSIRNDYSRYAGADISYSYACNPTSSYKVTSQLILHQSIAAMKAPIKFDESLNDTNYIAMNYFEWAIIAASRLNAYLQLSWKWKQQQNSTFIINFTRLLTKKLLTKLRGWVRRGVIKNSLNQTNVIFIIAFAVRAVWKMATRHRNQEINALDMLLKEVKKLGPTDNWEELFENYSIKSNMNIIMPRSGVYD